MKMTLASDVILFLALLADFTVSGTLFSISQNLQSSTIRTFDFSEDDLTALTSLDSLFWFVNRDIYPRLISVPGEAFSQTVVLNTTN